MCVVLPSMVALISSLRSRKHRKISWSSLGKRRQTSSSHKPLLVTLPNDVESKLHHVFAAKFVPYYLVTPKSFEKSNSKISLSTFFCQLNKRLPSSAGSKDYLDYAMLLQFSLEWRKVHCVLKLGVDFGNSNSPFQLASPPFSSRANPEVCTRAYVFLLAEPAGYSLLWLQKLSSCKRRFLQKQDLCTYP